MHNLSQKSKNSISEAKKFSCADLIVDILLISSKIQYRKERLYCPFKIRESQQLGNGLFIEIPNRKL
jgi:hypothetical protein